MDFPGPDATDYANVRSLNVEFLSLLRGDGIELRDVLPPDRQDRLRHLDDDQLLRLADVPFLLLSVRERDTERWQAILAENTNASLSLISAGGSSRERLTAATLGFLWPLARRNPYAARVVSGAPLGWCERLADTTLIRLLHSAAGHPDLLTLRTAGRFDLWSRLLDSGIATDRALREATHFAALQAMLTSGAVRRYRMRSAACSTTVPALTTGGKPRRRK